MGDGSSDNATDFSAVNELHAYTLAIECSMESTEMHRHVRARDVPKGPVQPSKLNLHPFSIECPDTRMRGQSYTGYIGQEDVPISFTEHAQAEILKLEKMYSEAYMQTVYLALMLGRTVAPADVLAVQQSSLWRKRSIDVDITAFLHSQDVAGLSRTGESRAQGYPNLQQKFSDLIAQSFTPLPFDVDPEHGMYYFCKPSEVRNSDLQVFLQLARNPLLINFQYSVEVIDGDNNHTKRLNQPVHMLPSSLDKLCEHAGISWRPPTDHFEPSMDVRVILHINCWYLPKEVAKQDGTKQPVEEPANILPPKPDALEISSRYSNLFAKTMSPSSLFSGAVYSISKGSVAVPSASRAKDSINAQFTMLDHLPEDQMDRVRGCHGKIVRFFAQETLYALRDISPVTVPLLKQVWHTIATTGDDDVPADNLEFAQNRNSMEFLIPPHDMQKRRHAMDLVIRELLKDHGSYSQYQVGKLHELGGFVYMRDIRSRSDRLKARERMRTNEPAQPTGSASALSDAIPSWFLIKPTPELDGVQILTHNYSVITGESANNVLAATRQLLRIALQAANTRLLLEEMAETHMCPSMLVVPDHKARLERKAGPTVMDEPLPGAPATTD
ncbi:hypothetical protein FBU59_003892, partial [Linderina macrospora]